MRMPIRTVFISLLSTALLTGCGQSTPPTRPTSQVKPVASFTVSPLSGEPGTRFQVDASDSSSRFGMIVCRWDWDNDGTWDTEFSTEKVGTHSYTVLGYKTIRLEVKDEREISATALKEVHIAFASDQMIQISAGEFVMGSVGRG